MPHGRKHGLYENIRLRRKSGKAYAQRKVQKVRHLMKTLKRQLRQLRSVLRKRKPKKVRSNGK